MCHFVARTSLTPSVASLWYCLSWTYCLRILAKAKCKECLLIKIRVLSIRFRWCPFITSNLFIQVCYELEENNKAICLFTIKFQNATDSIFQLTINYNSYTMLTNRTTQHIFNKYHHPSWIDMSNQSPVSHSSDQA